MFVFVFYSFQYHLDREKGPQTAMCLLEWLGRLKCRATGLEASLSLISISLRWETVTQSAARFADA